LHELPQSVVRLRQKERVVPGLDCPGLSAFCFS